MFFWNLKNSDTYKYAEDGYKNVKTWYNFMELFILYSKEMNDEKRSEPADLADGVPDCL